MKLTNFVHKGYMEKSFKSVTPENCQNERHRIY